MQQKSQCRRMGFGGDDRNAKKKKKTKQERRGKSKGIQYATYNVQNHYIKLTLGIRINVNAAVTFLASSAFSLCSVLPLTFRRTSSISGRFPGPFFFFSLAKIDDSLSGNGGISSKTVACRQILLKMNQAGKRRQMVEAEGTNQNVCAGDTAEPQVLNSPLLKLHVSISKLAV